MILLILCMILHLSCALLFSSTNLFFCLFKKLDFDFLSSNVFCFLTCYFLLFINNFLLLSLNLFCWYFYNLPISQI